MCVGIFILISWVIIMIKNDEYYMNKAIELEKEFKLKDIMYYQMLLEMHNGSLENFMCKLEIDWNVNPVKVALYNLLNKTMVRVDGAWMDK